MKAPNDPSRLGSLLDFISLAEESAALPVSLRVESERPNTTTAGHRRYKSMEETYPYQSKGFDARTRDSRPCSVNIEQALGTINTGFPPPFQPARSPHRPYSQITSRIRSFRPKRSGEVATPDPSKRRQNMMRSELM